LQVIASSWTQRAWQFGEMTPLLLKPSLVVISAVYKIQPGSPDALMSNEIMKQTATVTTLPNQ